MGNFSSEKKHLRKDMYELFSDSNYYDWKGSYLVIPITMTEN